MINCPKYPRYRRPRVNAYLGVFLALLIFGLALPVPAQEDGENTSTAVDAVALFQQGQDAHEKGDLAAAVELYGKAIAAMPEFPEAEYQRGQALLSLGKKDEAEKAFRRAVEIRPDWTLALSNLGSLLVGKGRYEEAERLLNKAISLDNQNTLAFSALTELRLNSKARPEELRELLGRLTVLTERARPTASAWAARAALEVALGEKAASRSSFEKALALEPRNLFAINAQANAALDEGDTNTGEALAKSLETIAPGSVSAKTVRARVLYAKGRTDEAIALLDGIKDPPPGVISLRDKIEITKIEDGPDLETQLGKNPNDPFILGKLCSVYRVPEPEKALVYCRRAAEADPSNVGHAIGFAGALVQSKRYNEAVELLRRLQAAAPDNVTIRTNLATALFQLKRYSEAKSEYKWITERQPASAAAYYFLAIVHDQLLEFPDAMANYQLFLRHADPDKNKTEIEKVNLRLPTLQKQIKEKKRKRS